MLADQFIAAASGAANSRALDQISRLVWRAHAEGHVDDAQAGAPAEALQARRRAANLPASLDSLRIDHGSMKLPRFDGRVRA
jgi:hypothetical protein